ncbi:histone H4 transcription factor isoform X1 [Bactrocera dorsalis]|uniref:Histone H4 transcription factor isoform X1 n=2 Tax=Bactrocera dorsalis TaxID=27457 RepID=A0A6I9V545_BACDO|nr:histone H4 transcription factor isoform X1 [Bactrocera dorsalis]
MISAKKSKQMFPPVPCQWKECVDLFNDDWKLNEHIKRHLDMYVEEDNETFDCPWNKCNFFTTDYTEIKRHIYYHGYYSSLVVRGKYECEQNPNIPRCSARPKEADKIPDLKSNFLCEWTDCQRTFVSIVEFQDHIVQHALFEYEIQKSPNDTRPKVKCKWSICLKHLENKYRLIEHIFTHANKKSLACYHCGEVFRTRTTLFDHLRRQPENNTHKFQCDQCFKYFATEKLLRSHFLKHVNCYKCSLCNMSCPSSSSLATHIRYRHLKDKPFKCTECEHRCVRKSDLQKHMNHIHSNQVHRCQQSGCNYAVRTYNLLRRHCLEVHGNSPFIYMCHCCDKLFKHSKYLSKHLIKKHDFKLPSGHKRFTYRIDENGFYLLETLRIESLEVTKQILSPHAMEASDVTQDSSCYEIVSMTNEHDQRVIVANDPNEAQLVGEVVISLPLGNES